MFSVFKNRLGSAAYSAYQNDGTVLPVILLFDTCFQQYIRDTVALVASGVTASVSRELERNNMQHTEVSKRRLKYLKMWMKMSHPFEASEDAMGALMLAVHPNRGHPTSLPYADYEPELTLKALSHSTITTARTSRPGSVTAPFIAKSQTVNLLHIALVLAEAHWEAVNKVSREALLSQAISIVLTTLKIHNVIWSPPPPVGNDALRRRRVSNKPLYCHWRLLNTVHDHASAATRNFITASNDPLAITRLNIQASNVVTQGGPWSIATLPLTDFHRYTHKTVNPQDVLLKYASVESADFLNPTSDKHYVYRQLAWAMQILNFKKPPHRLIVYCARIMAATAPYLAPDQTYQHPHHASTNEEIVRAIQSIPLLSPPRSGVTRPQPLIVLFIGYALGLLYPESPLSQHITANPNPKSKGSLGMPWTKKLG